MIPSNGLTFVRINNKLELNTTATEETIEQNKTLANKTLEALTGKDLTFKNATPSREILVEQNVLVKTLKINIINKANENSIFKPIVL